MRDCAKGTTPEEAAGDLDAPLVAFENQFLALVAELDRDGENLKQSDEYLTARDEALLARLDPVERAIMGTPAYTMTGLSVKARHLAYVLSEYWEAPIDQIGWEGRAVRLLVEAICNVASTPLSIRKPQVGKQQTEGGHRDPNG
ncbi:hypothetical protein S58_69120 [Bradyrhizobium oligotrophicum S58]|uniref:Uncharacterized protein n=1 Tax=Bradyrhizobium oligotrophicum S58 TaxID=1245469 RepID=M4ZGE5_9BRAD|nr:MULTISPECIES: hypothetical protein [Bradyrhizobium]BAM92878.1 hypothetical protein S58_69120 [Bradyrhizobium oligotrophicum S58]